MSLAANQSRMLFASLVIATTYLLHYYYFPTLESQSVNQVIAYSLAMTNILTLWIILIPEHGIRSTFSISSFALYAVSLSGFLLGNQWMPAASESWIQINQSIYLEELPLPTLPTALLAFSGGMALIFLLRRRNATEASLLALPILTAFTYLTVADKSITVAFTAASTGLLFGLLYTFIHLGFRDELTRLKNRRALDQTSSNLSKNYAVVMLDIDHFKKVNDTHGHDVGDQVLKSVANIIQRYKNNLDAYRYGGEEFCLIAKGRSIEKLDDLLDQLRLEIAGFSMVLRDTNARTVSDKTGAQKRGKKTVNKSLSVNVSMGYAIANNSNHSFETLHKLADQALYTAKGAGRNCIKKALVN